MDSPGTLLPPMPPAHGVVREMRPRGLVGPGNSLPALGRQCPLKVGDARPRMFCLEFSAPWTRRKGSIYWLHRLGCRLCSGAQLDPGPRYPVPGRDLGHQRTPSRNGSGVSQFLCLHKVGPASQSLQGVGCPPPPLPTASRRLSKAWVVAVLELCPCPRVCISRLQGPRFPAGRAG